MKNALKIEMKASQQKKMNYGSIRHLNPLYKDYSLSVKQSNVGLKDIKKYSINDIDSFKIVFVDGVLTHSYQIQRMAWIYVYLLLYQKKV